MKDAAVTWLHQWPATGPVAFRIGRTGEEVIAEWVGTGTLRADLKGTWNEFVLASGADPESRELLGEHIDAMLRQLRGNMTLHASSVAFGGIALACLGNSGAGKSTMAAQLCADPAVEFLSDDAAALDHSGPSIRVVAAERHHWLRADVARMRGIDPGEHLKIPVAAARPAKSPLPLRALVTLVFDREAHAPTLRPLHGARAFSALNLSLFRFALDVPDILKRELDVLARIVEETLIFELRRSPDLAQLDSSSHLVSELLHELPHRAS